MTLKGEVGAGTLLIGITETDIGIIILTMSGILRRVRSIQVVLAWRQGNGERVLTLANVYDPDREDLRMIVEYLHDGAPECPLLRLFGTNRREFVELREIARHLGDYANRSYELASLGNYALRNVESFVLANSGEQRVIVNGSRAEWGLSRENWHVVSMLIEPLSQLDPEEEGFQWLSGPEALDPLSFGDCSIVLSHSREGIW